VLDQQVTVTFDAKPPVVLEAYVRWGVGIDKTGILSLDARLVTRCTTNDSEQPFRNRHRISSDFVLPYPDNSPALRGQLLTDQQVARSVVFDFAAPELCTRSRRLVVQWTPMPKATVDEDGDSRSGKHEVGFAGET
jgi:hypothetical protein